MSHPSRRVTRKRADDPVTSRSQGRSTNPALPIIGSAILVIIIAGAIIGPRLTARAKEAVQSVTPTNIVSQRTAVPDPTAQPTRDSAAAELNEQVQALTSQDGLIKVAASGLADGRARFYVVQGMNKPVPFFLVQSADGTIRVALDACDVCFAAKKGYHQEGDEMVCNNCGTHFPSAKIGQVRGGCNPVPLTHQVRDGTIVIKTTDIEAGASYF